MLEKYNLACDHFRALFVTFPAMERMGSTLGPIQVYEGLS